MANTNFKSVDEYLETKPPEVQEILQRVRATLRKALPGAKELISYQMPAYRVPEGVVIFFAAWKEHWSLYPVTAETMKPLEEQLAKYERSKGTLRFPLSAPVPVRLIQRIAQLQAAQVLERAAVRKKRKR